MAVAAYSSVLSLLRVLDNVKHPSRIRLLPDKTQIDDLQEKLLFLQKFLEDHSSTTTTNAEIENVARQIPEVTYDAEDVIDKFMVDKLRVACDVESDDDMGLNILFHDESDDDYMSSIITSFQNEIHEAIQKIESINQALMTVVTNHENHTIQTVQERPRVTATSSRKKKTLVGFEEQLNDIMDKLAGNQRNLEIISIVGMGGSGKTTLARSAFDHKWTLEHFHVRIWLTISQEYSVKEILLGLVHDGVLDDRKGDGADESVVVADLKTKLYQKLFGKTYLIVMDDVWSEGAWDDMKGAFPDNGNGSRIILTTRLSNVANALGRDDSNIYSMRFLNEDKSWELFSDEAFANGERSPELEEIGRKISESCRGLPLALVVIGGLLAKSNMTRECWELVAKNVSSLANSEDNENCLNILSLSYHHLPIHLKPCFLYMRHFGEDSWIKVSDLIRTWACEGIVKPVSEKTLEEAANEYFEDLIGRNMFFIRGRGKLGKVKYCGIHDLLRDLCIKESEDLIRRRNRCWDEEPWKLQWLINESNHFRNNKKIKIWDMPQLRHLILTDYELPDPPIVTEKDLIVLENLQTLEVASFKFTEDIVTRIPNLKQLKVKYEYVDIWEEEEDWSYYCLQNLVRLQKLESLCINIKFDSEISPGVKSIAFPQSLKKLTLSRGGMIAWDDLTIIGSLPNLEVLELLDSSVLGEEWSPIEEEFLRLKYLLLKGLKLVRWRADETHFPSLETLYLENMHHLESIPQEFGDLPNLRSIYLDRCRETVVNSARKIVEEQLSCGNEGSTVHVGEGIWMLLDPPLIVNMENLQTLEIHFFKCTEEIVERIPNLKELELYYWHPSTSSEEELEWSHYCLQNLARLQRLESLWIRCRFISMDVNSTAFPPSLKELSLAECRIAWDDLTIIGSLPNLEVLTLSWESVVGEEWSPIEGEFLRLKYLKLYGLDLVRWRADDTHFPSLETLSLKFMNRLEAIPQEFGDLPNLRLIDIYMCHENVVNSARKIVEEQQSYGNDKLTVHVSPSRSS